MYHAVHHATNRTDHNDPRKVPLLVSYYSTTPKVHKPQFTPPPPLRDMCVQETSPRGFQDQA